MKMTKEHFQGLLEKIKTHVDNMGKKEAEMFSACHKDMAYRWSLLWATNPCLIDIYEYCNDDHIDTALRKIMKLIVQEKEKERR
jgi:hypothetical protein